MYYQSYRCLLMSINIYVLYFTGYDADAKARKYGKLLSKLCIIYSEFVITFMY